MSGQACRSVLLDKDKQKGTHPGLLLSRYIQFPVADKEIDEKAKKKYDEAKKKYDEAKKKYDEAKKKYQEARKDLFDSVIKACRSYNLSFLYKQAYKRWTQTIEAAFKDKVIKKAIFSVTGRLIVGLSGESVLETGLALHHTYGVPIIPGSALKGLASHYCHQVWGAEDNEFKCSKDYQGKYHRVLFGDTGGDKDDEGSGHISFYDAWIDPNSLKDAILHDVITTHHQDYYAGKPDAAPTDHDEPNPVTFLSVRGDFRVYLSCKSIGGEEWTTLAMQLLKQALSNWGIGGKTNSGYGYGRLDVNELG